MVVDEENTQAVEARDRKEQMGSARDLYTTSEKKGGCNRALPGATDLSQVFHEPGSFFLRHDTRRASTSGERQYDRGKAIRSLEAPSPRDLRHVVCDSASGDTGSGSVRDTN